MTGAGLQYWRALALLTGLTGAAPAQVLQPPLHFIPPPPSVPQYRVLQGEAVAMNSRWIAVGMPDDGTSGNGAGAISVFDAATRGLRFKIPNPGPRPDFDGGFGTRLALSGSRMVAGNPFADSAGGDGYAGLVYVFDFDDATPKVPILVIENPTPAANDIFGMCVAVSGTRIVVGAPRDNGGALEAGAAYVFDLNSANPGVPVVTLSNPEPALKDGFGSAVAVSGTRVIVGAAKDDVLGSDAGSVYIYDLAGATPAVPVRRLNGPGASNGDNFGSSVAASGTWVAVGAEGVDAGAENAGGIFVYDLTDIAPGGQVYTLPNPEPAANDAFGRSVALSGSLLAAGDWEDDAGALNSGSVRVYDLQRAAPGVPVLTLLNPSPAEDDRFGFAVAISGTLIAAGAPRDDSVIEDAGSVAVFDVMAANPQIPLAVMDDTGPAPEDYFGMLTAISGTRAVVANNYLDRLTMTWRMTAHVFDFAGPSPAVPVVSLPDPTPATEDHTIWSTGISGDLVVVGCYESHAGLPGLGVAHVHDLTAADPAVPAFSLTIPGQPGPSSFASAVGISGRRVAVGYSSDSSRAAGAGSVYVYDLDGDTPLLPVVILHNPEPAREDGFGGSVVISGTLVAVGTPFDSTGAHDAGSVYVFDLSSDTPTVPVATLHNPEPEPFDQFGGAVAVSGTRVAVGAAPDDAGARNAGSVYVYDLANETPETPVLTLRNPEPGEGERFGINVDLSGTRLLVTKGAGGHPNGEHVYVFELSAANPAVPSAILLNPTPVLGEGFGLSAAIDGEFAIVGAPLDGTVMREKGFAYLYGPNARDQDGDGLRDAWEVSHWGTAAGHGPEDDFDRDGYNELLELALGLDPKSPNPGGLPAATRENGYLTMTLTKQPGVLYEVQSAGRLTAGQNDSFSAESTTVLINSGATLQVRDNIVTGAKAARFMRVKVMAAP